MVQISVFWSSYKIGLVFGFPNWHSVGIGLVLVWKFSESGITSVGGRGGEGEEGRPDLSNTNTGASVAGVEYSLWHWAAWRRPKNDKIFTNARTNVPFLLHRGTWNLSLRTWIGGLLHCARIFRLRWTVCSEIERKRPNRPGCGQPALAWDGNKVDFPSASGGEGPVLQLLSALGLDASSSTNRAMYDFVTKLASLRRMLGSV